MLRNGAASLHGSTNVQKVCRIPESRGHLSRRQLTSRAFNARVHSSLYKKYGAGFGAFGRAATDERSINVCINLYILEWTRALNAREVSCRRLKWPRPSWIRQTFCTFVEPCREAAPFRSIDFSPLVSSCRASPALILSYLVLASVALVFSCLGRLWNRAGKHRRFGA